MMQEREAKFRRDWMDRQRASEKRRMMALEREKTRLRTVNREQLDQEERLVRDKERMR